MVSGLRTRSGDRQSNIFRCSLFFLVRHPGYGVSMLSVLTNLPSAGFPLPSGSYEEAAPGGTFFCGLGQGTVEPFPLSSHLRASPHVKIKCKTRWKKRFLVLHGPVFPFSAFPPARNSGSRAFDDKMEAKHVLSFFLPPLFCFPSSPFPSSFVVSGPRCSYGVACPFPRSISVCCVYLRQGQI